MLGERIRCLKNGVDGNCMYCSDECKNSCSLYRFNPTQFLQTHSEKFYTSYEYQVFRQEVLKRQRIEYGSNSCERCESINNLHVHHEKPQKTHSIMSLDPDNGIILCIECHLKKTHSGPCSMANLANKQC